MFCRNVLNHHRPYISTSLSRSGSIEGKSVVLRSTFHTFSETNHVGSGSRFTKLLFGQNAPIKCCHIKQRARQLLYHANEQLTILSKLFAKQCHALAAQRIRRATQISLLYKELGYDRHLLSSFAQNVRNSLIQKAKPTSLLLGASLFCWENERISEAELGRVANEINLVHRDDNGKVQTHLCDGWEVVIEKKDLKAWRKAIPDTYLYEYKMYGTFTDIPARAFFNAQTDIKYRRQWDKLIIKLDVVEKENNTGNEVVQWIMHFPYPMYSREYVYVRKRMIDHGQKVMVLMSRSTEHPKCPREEDKYVRVDTYMSHMVIRPHKSFDDNGFDFVLTYHDDPKSAFPKVAYNWMASTGVPDFVEKMHNAARTMHEWKKQGKWIDEESEEENVTM